MTIERWLESATADVMRRGLPELVPMLEGLAAALRALRTADFIERASGVPGGDRPARPSTSHPA
jgi:hypothetical protein